MGADALIIPPEVSEAAAPRLAQELNLSREPLYLSATHTHSSPMGWAQELRAVGRARILTLSPWRWGPASDARRDIHLKAGVRHALGLLFRQKDRLERL